MEEPGIGYWFLRILASIVGVLLIYAAAFTYPEERKGLHNKLEDWWLHLHEMSGTALKRHVVFIQKTAATAKSGFDWLFGSPFSTRFFIASGLLSMASFAIGMMNFGDYGWAVPTGLALFAAGILTFTLLIGRSHDKMMRDIEDVALKRQADLIDIFEPDERLAKVRRETARLELEALTQDYPSASRYGIYEEKKPWWEDLLSPETTSSLAAPAALTVLSFSSAGLVFVGAREKGVDEQIFILAVLTAFVCDAICILVTVYFLDRICRSRSAITAAAFFLVDAFVAAAMLIVPWIAFLKLAEADSSLAHYLAFVAAANVSTALPSVVFFLVAFAALAHRLFWPLILRPFYNLIHAEKITKPKTLGLFGLACFSVWLDIPEDYKPFFEKFLNLM